MVRGKALRATLGRLFHKKERGAISQLGRCSEKGRKHHILYIVGKEKKEKREGDGKEHSYRAGCERSSRPPKV